MVTDRLLVVLPREAVAVRDGDVPAVDGELATDLGRRYNKKKKKNITTVIINSIMVNTMNNMNYINNNNNNNIN